MILLLYHEPIDQLDKADRVQTRGLQCSLSLQVCKDQGLVNLGTVRANLVGKQFKTVARNYLTICQEYQRKFAEKIFHKCQKTFFSVS